MLFLWCLYWSILLWYVGCDCIGVVGFMGFGCEVIICDGGVCKVFFVCFLINVLNVLLVVDVDKWSWLLWFVIKMGWWGVVDVVCFVVVVII